MLAVLPKGTRLIPVGGIDEATIPPYAKAGALGFGLGSAIFKPGMSVEDIALRAASLKDAWKQVW
jgi:2-dehydro-3-deoxyphosphogalactonate aldolase